MKTLLDGDTVNVFEDPLTEENLEGEATIKKVMSHHGLFNGRTIYRCMVKFKGDKKHYSRKVLA